MEKLSIASNLLKFRTASGFPEPNSRYNIRQLNKSLGRVEENPASKTDVPTTTGGPTRSLLQQEV